MAKRLTEKEKYEILESFKSGKSIGHLSEKYNCNKLTITRNLKKSLGELQYKELINKKKSTGRTSNDDRPSNINLNNEISKKVSVSSQILEDNREDSDFSPLESFLEIAPVNYEIENLPRKELSSVPISKMDFPKVVYMIVDKKIELETKYLKEYPNWQFLAEKELKRKTIEIYVDFKNAKRFCNKEQKVIKVPNTKVFKIVAPLLLSRGISRIINSDQLIAL